MFRRFFEFIVIQFIAFASNVSDLIEIVIQLPFTLLGGQSENSTVGRILLILFQIIWFPIYAIGWVILAPLRLLTDFSDARRQDFMYGLPAVFVIGFIVFVLIYVNVRADAIEAEYRSKGQELMSAEDYDGAKTYYGRVMSDKSNAIEASDVFNWAVILGRTGEPNRAIAILDRLAPGDRVGYFLAHRLKAVSLAQALGDSKDPLILSKLRWHLENSRGETEQSINRAWTVYYIAVKQPEKALPYLERSASENAADLIDLARLHNQLGNEMEGQSAIALAESKFRSMVDKDPLDTRNRILLANVLVRLEKIDDAEAVLLTGLGLQADPTMLRSAADFYVMRYDLARKNNASLTEQFELLHKAMQLDVDYPIIYQRFVDFYQTNIGASELNDIKSAMLEAVTGDQPSALAHFALSNVYGMENDTEKAEWHLERAYSLDPNFVVVLNNLAWTIANKENPDLDRAHALAKKVVDRFPGDGRFRDTYATVLMMQEKYPEAALEFEKTLATITIKGPIHQKLANCYRKLGKNELADLHAKQAER